MKNRFAITLIAGGAVSAAALYLAFRNVPFDDLWHYLRTIEYGWIVPSAALVALAFFLRALRWQIILSESGKVTFWQAFHPLMIGFMMNCILPARVGEIARPVILKKQRGIPVSTGLSTLVAERVFDILLLITLFALLFSNMTIPPGLKTAAFGIELSSDMLMAVAWGMVRLSLVLLLFIGLLIIAPTRNLITECFRWVAARMGRQDGWARTFAVKFSNFVIKIIDNFHTGLTVVKRPAKLMATLVLTLLIWTFSVLAYWVFALGCPGIDLTLTQLTTVMVVVSFFIALPSVPGFWGLWEVAGVFGLALFGVAQKDALGYTLVNHAIQIFPVILIGMISAVITGVNFWQISQNVPAMDLQRPSRKGV